MGFYCLLFGWIIKYMVEFGIAIFNPASTFWTMDSAEYFSMFISNPVEPLIWTFVGLLLAYLCVRKNMAGGIEKACKWMIPALVVLLIVVAIRACTLPGAEAGIEFLFQPSTENVMTSGGWLTVFGIALAQMFFSLNVGFGTNLICMAPMPLTTVTWPRMPCWFLWVTWSSLCWPLWPPFPPLSHLAIPPLPAQVCCSSP